MAGYIFEKAPGARASVLSARPRAVMVLLMGAALASCGKLDHFGRPPTMSSVAAPRDPVDPTLPQGPEIPAETVLGQPGGVLTSRSGGGRVLRDGRGPDGRALRGEDVDALGFAPGYVSPSLWSSQPNSLFGDRRARAIGDILTVMIDIADSANVNNSTSRSRSSSDQITASTVFGLEEVVDNILPQNAEIANGLDAAGTSSAVGSGQIVRDETISLRIAATVVRVLPNGHFVITGNQEVRVNYELRDLQVAGVIRPEDISRQNTITYDKIANARISYGGRGQLFDYQQPRYGQQIVDIISPY